MHGQLTEDELELIDYGWGAGLNLEDPDQRLVLQLGKHEPDYQMPIGLKRRILGLLSRKPETPEWQEARRCVEFLFDSEDPIAYSRTNRGSASDALIRAFQSERM